MITKQFIATGAEQTFAVPEGVTKVDLKLVGAPGGGSNAASGGLGAVVFVNDVPVSPGGSLSVEVGSPGSTLWRIGDFNGGGRGWRNGGGATDVRTKPTSEAGTLNSRLAVAAGGGGAGGTSGGGSGGAAGQPGEASHDGKAGGAPGTDTSGGGGDAGFGIGGHTGSFGGGGGGGWYGGAAGQGQDGRVPGSGGGGGGGGSSHVSAGSNAKILPNTANPPLPPQALISYTAPQGRLQQLSSGKCATAPVTFGDFVTLQPCAGPADALFTRQQFRWVYLDGGALNLYMPWQDGCVDTAKAGSDNGTPLVLGACSGSPSQAFAKQFPTEYQGYIQQSSRLWIDTNNASSADGTALVIGIGSGTASQQWRRLANPGT